MQTRNWPYLWGFGTPQQFAIEENKRYLFPEHTQPFEAPDLQKLVDQGVDYSVDPQHLGMMDVVLTGKEFIEELEARGIADEPEIGAWTP